MFKLSGGFLIAIILFLFSFSSMLFAAEKSNSSAVRGVVVDEKTKKPIAGIELQLIKSDKVSGDKIFISGEPIEAVSDDKGGFIFKNVSEGKYLLLQYMEQLKSGGKTVIVAVVKGQTTDLGKIAVRKPK
jgi:hypothetical protein